MVQQCQAIAEPQSVPLGLHVPALLPSGFVMHSAQICVLPPLVFTPLPPIKEFSFPCESLQVGADTVVAPPFQKERLGFYPSLGFLQSHGMVIPRGGEALPYPLSLSVLLQDKSSLTMASLWLLCRSLEIQKL